ncbi:DUF1641 domain-containing protein [Paenibacillus medicaginis]|uniref:DUF1641 domain-containing protein n=1 Tax=Paenibacillus medicaginis TaxID=1470560 RepID=A0ABV5BXQ6_9BACL
MSENQQEVAATQEATTESRDVLDQLMKPEVQQSLTVLVENLPKLTEMVTVMTGAYDVARSLATDPVFIGDMKNSMTEFVKPVTESAKGIASAAIEAGDRVQTESGTVGLFAMLKMLKDPNVQKGLRFASAFLDIMNERQAQNK